MQHEIVVIQKSKSPDRIAENFDVWSFTLCDAEMRLLDQLGE